LLYICAIQMGNGHFWHWILVDTSKNTAYAKLMPDSSVTAKFQTLMPNVRNNAKNVPLPNRNLNCHMPFKNAKFDSFGISKSQLATLSPKANFWGFLENWEFHRLSSSGHVTNSIIAPEWKPLKQPVILDLIDFSWRIATTLSSAFKIESISWRIILRFLHFFCLYSGELEWNRAKDWRKTRCEAVALH